MNRVGIIVDCSHAALTTTIDIISESVRPVVFSHSNPVSVWNHQRNISDEQIRACAETGGVIGINGLGIFLGDNDIENETLLRHICYVSDLVGPEHVGIGFDYSPEIDLDIGDILKSRPDYWPPGQQYETPGIQHAGPSQLRDLTHRMIEHGFSSEETRGILGGNFRRVAAGVWQNRNSEIQT
jgi:membrane dipeptidase